MNAHILYNNATGFLKKQRAEKLIKRAEETEGLLKDKKEGDTFFIAHREDYRPVVRRAYHVGPPDGVKSERGTPPSGDLKEKVSNFLPDVLSGPVYQGCMVSYQMVEEVNAILVTWTTLGKEDFLKEEGPRSFSYLPLDNCTPQMKKEAESERVLALVGDSLYVVETVGDEKPSQVTCHFKPTLGFSMLVKYQTSQKVGSQA